MIIYTELNSSYSINLIKTLTLILFIFITTHKIRVLIIKYIIVDAENVYYLNIIRIW